MSADQKPEEVRLTEAEREALWAAGDHEPAFCDCTADIIEQAFAEDCCCEGLLLTFEAAEMVIGARLADARAEWESPEHRKAVIDRMRELVVENRHLHSLVERWEALADGSVRSVIERTSRDEVTR